MSLSEQFLRTEGAKRDFASTQWSLVLLAGSSTNSADSHSALERLCRAYWHPIYAYIRRQGYSAEEAADLTQDFFSALLANHSLARVHPAKGRFRSFLIACLKNHLANAWDRAQCLKRGGGSTVFSLDQQDAERTLALEQADPLTPEKVFDRRWAETLLALALDRVREECDGVDKARRFDVLKEFLIQGRGGASFEQAAATLGLSVSAVKAQVHRLRERFRDHLRREIAQTVNSPAEVDQEIRELFNAFTN